MIYDNRAIFAVNLPHAIRLLNSTLLSAAVIQTVHEVCMFLLAANSFGALAFAISCGLALYLTWGDFPTAFNSADRQIDPRDRELQQNMRCKHQMLGFETWTSAFERKDHSEFGWLYVDGAMRNGLPIRFRRIRV